MADAMTFLGSALRQLAALRMASALLLLAALPLAWGSTLSGIAHVPEVDTLSGIPYQAPLIEPLNRLGVQEDTAAKNLSQFVHIGCFIASMAITRDAEQDTHFDPAACVEVCRARYPNSPAKEIAAAVHGARCGCNVGPIYETFTEVDSVYCNYPCKNYLNPICGGLPSFWNVFVQYDFQSFASHGAYDPWRKIWYTVVAVRESSIIGPEAWNPDLQLDPERYYLHAASVQTGQSAFPNQARLPGIVHGIKYDLDSRRLVGVMTSASTARIRMLQPWQYWLFTATIETANPLFPSVTFDEELPLINFGEAMSEQFMAWTTNSAIYSRNGRDIFVFCQAEPAGLLKNTKSRVYFISIPDAVMIEAQGLDFTVLQLMVNEKDGDVVAVGHRSGYMMIVTIATIYLNEVENAKRVDWMYTPALPQRLVPTEDFGDLFLTPGLVASEHLFAKSFIMVRKYPVDWTEPRDPELYPPILMEISIREQIYFDWCPADCKGTVSYKSPYTPFFNKEPRIPLSLAAPALVYARFSMEAVTIDVQFDRATLRGALPVSTTGDIVPDIIDYTTQLTGDAWDCANVFDEDTIILLGPFPETNCKWASDDLIQISLPRVFDIQVGDQIFLKADIIYTIPRPQENEYSMAAQGGIAISLPDPLEQPVVIITGQTEIDECSPLQLYATDSYFLGGKATYRWELLGYTDLTNNPAGRIYNQTKLDLFRFVLENATNFNEGKVESPPQYLEEAVAFTINLTVTSRWGLPQSELVEVTKLDYPAPMVSILGPKEQLVNRTEQVSLLANGVPSECSTVSRQLGYRWSETTGQLDLSAMTDIVYTTRSLVIPPFVLEPIGSGTDLNIYNFTVETFAIDNPNKAAYAFVTVKVRRSPVFAYLATEDRLMTRGDILVLDARESQDPDYPTNPGMTFMGTFQWWCLTPERLPCFGTNSTGLLPTLDSCITDFDSRIVQGGKTFSTPLFDNGLYCRWARGVLMVSTVNFTSGEYIFEVMARSNDGRYSTKDTRITITELVVPQIRLTIDNPRPKYPVTSEISISGTVESELDPTVTLEFSWRVLVYSANPLYDGDRAREAEQDNDPTTVYLVDKMVYIDQTDVYDVTNASRFFTRPDSPNMIIKGNVLQESTIYKIRLVMTVGGGAIEGYTDVSLETAGLPPRSGTLLCVPLNATMDTKRVISAPDWVANDLPLNYQFGYMYYLGIGMQPITVRLNTAPQRVQQIEVDELPIGEPSTGFSLEVFVDIITPFGATTTKTIQVFSLPPKNATEIILRKLDDARTSDPETAINTLMTILNIAQAPSLPPGQQPSPELTAILTQVRDVMITNTNEAPVTINTAVNQAVVINGIIDAGMKDETSMNVLEDMVQNYANAGLYNVNDPSLIEASLYALGNILPNSGAETALAATGNSLGMSKYQNTRGETFEYTTVEHEDEIMASHVLSTFSGRLPQNHPLPYRDERVIDTCQSAYCDMVWLMCIHMENRKAYKFMCCDSPNPRTNCEHPPCWFYGPRCPVDETSAASAAAAPAVASALASARRLNETERKLQFATTTTPAPALSGAGALIWNLEQDELPVLLDVQQAIEQQDRLAEANLRAAAQVEASYALMSAFERDRKRQEATLAEENSVRAKKEDERQVSQLITRAAVLRDTICKQVIVQLTTGAPPMRFVTPGFVLYMGRTRNMSQVSPVFVFPEKFAVPPTAGNTPTPGSNVTAFSFIFVEYVKNIYGWSDSAPPGNLNLPRIITLLVMRASTIEIEVRYETFPIRVFADQTISSSGLCLYWDRFAPDTSGGAWSPQGLLNNGDGCLTTHLSDIGLFVDGRPAKLLEVDRAISYYIDEVVDVGTNYSQMAILGFILLLGTFCALWGYIQDELMREQLKSGKDKSSPYNLAGDGVTTPLTVLDPIAYNYTDRKNLFLAVTFWRVLKRDHALLSPVFYHEVFSRPQRILCLGVLATGVMAVNAIIYGNPSGIVSGDQFIASGVLSALVAFPLFCAVTFMFQTRPTPAKKRLVKKSANADQMETIAKVRREIEAKSTLAPPPGYLNLPAPPAPGSVGGTTLLSLPPPMMALPPPQPSSQFGPPQPRLPMAQLPGMPGLPALPGLPPLPTLKAANPALGTLPPPPKYPQPPARGMRNSGSGPAQAALTAPPPPPGGRTLSNPSLPGLRAVEGASPGVPGMDREALPNMPGIVAEAQHQAADEAEEAAGTARRLQPEASHGMAPGQPPLPPLSGPPPPPKGARTPTGGMTPTGGATPMGHTPAGSTYNTPRTPPPLSANTPGTGDFLPPALPKEMPPMPTQPQGVTRGVVHRGDAPTFIPVPFKGTPGRPGLPPGMPSLPPGRPGAKGGVPPPPPPPPPPPREDDPTFVRRVRLAYIDRAAKSHAQLLQDEGQDPGWVAPEWVYQVTLMSPYIASSASIACQVVLQLAYSTKFQRVEEQHWAYACIVGICLALLVLEVVRSAVTTVVELRKFEIRRRLVGGDFLKSRIRKTDVGLKGRTPPAKKPAVPLAPPRNLPKNAPPPPPSAKPPVVRPAFLPKEGPPGTPGAKGAAGVPSFRTVGGKSLPVTGPPPPPPLPPGVKALAHSPAASRTPSMPSMPSVPSGPPSAAASARR
ncbi:unnamed protein product [Effrenium voratum]|nr:unnamed protein product [Effrenium voratum]